MTPAPGKSLAVNVDIDCLRLYRHIHGLEPENDDSDPIWKVGVPRFLELFAELHLAATFFVVASDLVTVKEGGAAPSEEEAEKRREQVREIVRQGHEVASHSFSHDYALSQASYSDLYSDLHRAREVLREVSGQEICGFRAPGYILSPALVSAIFETKHSYSSSRFPSPPYFLAKWATMLGMSLVGRSSGAIAGEITAPLTSRIPYQHDCGLLELPMSVIPLARLPAIGTFFTLYGDAGLTLLLPVLNLERWLNIEFHAIDLLDSTDLPEGDILSDHQPDLSSSVQRKKSLFKRWLVALSHIRENKTLVQIAEGLQEPDAPH